MLMLVVAVVLRVLYLDDATTPRRLTTQTSVMNGSLAAENIEVDKVCDAGGIFDNDRNDGPRPSRSK